MDSHDKENLASVNVKDYSQSVLTFSPIKGPKVSSKGSESRSETLICTRFQESLLIDFKYVLVGSCNRKPLTFKNPNKNTITLRTNCKKLEENGLRFDFNGSFVNELKIDPESCINGFLVWQPTCDSTLRQSITLRIDDKIPLSVIATGIAGTGKDTCDSPKASSRRLSTATVNSKRSSIVSKVSRESISTQKLSVPIYDENWVEKQESAVVDWINFQFCEKVEDGRSKPSNLEVDTDVSIDSSLSDLLERKREEKTLITARKLFQGDSFMLMMCSVDKDVASGKLSLRVDRDILYDVGLQEEMIEVIGSYDSAWLKIGLQVIFQTPFKVPSKCKSFQIVPLCHRSVADVDVYKHVESGSKLYLQTLRAYIHQNLLNSDDIETQFGKTKLLTKPQEKKRLDLLRKHVLKSFFALVLFLDTARANKVLSFGALFNCNALYKSSKDILIAFCRLCLRGEGDIIKHLSTIGVELQFSQKYIDEFNFFVTDFKQDLKDGVRLSKLLEILSKSNNLALCSNLRVPAVSRLQKVSNVNKMLEVYYQVARVSNASKIDSKLIVDGNREATLALLWQMMYSFELRMIVNLQLILDESVVVRRDQVWRQSIYPASSNGSGFNVDDFAVSVRNSKFSLPSNSADSATSININEVEFALLRWVQSITEQYELSVVDLTSSLSDGRALCLIIHYYHPKLLQTKQIKKTTHHLCVGYSNDELQQALANEKKNFALVRKCVKEIGGVPLLLLNNNITSKHVVDEKTMVVFLTYLFNRLVETAAQVRAAIIIQKKTRQYLASTHRRVKSAEISPELVKVENAVLCLSKKQEAAIKVVAFVKGRRMIRAAVGELTVLKAERDKRETVAVVSSIVHSIVDTVEEAAQVEEVEETELKEVVIGEKEPQEEVDEEEVLQEKEQAMEVLEEIVLMEKKPEEEEEVDIVFEQKMSDIDHLDYTFIEENLTFESDEQTIALLDSFRDTCKDQKRRKSSNKKKARISFGLEQRYEQLLSIMQDDKANLQAQLEMQKVMHSLHLLQLNETDEQQRQELSSVYEARLGAVQQVMREQEEALKTQLQEEKHRRLELERKIQLLEEEKWQKATEEQQARAREEMLKKSSVFIASFICARVTRRSYLKTISCAVKVQAFIRGFISRQRFVRHRLATVILQSCFRRRIVSKRLVVMNEASRVIVFYMRAFMCRINFVATRHAAMLVQRCMRRFMQRQQERKVFRAVQTIQRVVTRFIFAKKYSVVVVKLQSVVRRALAIRRRSAMARARHVIISALESFVARRKNNLERVVQRKARKVIAQFVANYMSGRKRARCVRVIQRFYRHIIITLRIKKLIRGFNRLVAVARAHKLRVKMFAKNDRLKQLFYRIKEANMNALKDPSLKLGRRTSIALMTLQTGKMISHLLKACHTLFLSTQLSRRCCEAFATAGASQILFNLLRSCNRSTPHQELLRMALVVLLNVARHPHLAGVMVTVTNSNVSGKKSDCSQLSVEAAETLIDLMQMFRDKKSIFLLAIELLSRLVHASATIKTLCNTAMYKKRIDGILHIMLRKDRLNTKIKQTVSSLSGAGNGKQAGVGSNGDFIRGTNSTHTAVASSFSNEGEDLFNHYRGKQYDSAEPLSCLEHLFSLLKENN